MSKPTHQPIGCTAVRAVMTTPSQKGSLDRRLGVGGSQDGVRHRWEGVEVGRLPT